MAAPPPALDDTFPADYTASRAAFRQDCAVLLRRADDFCRSYAVRDDKDNDLTIDYAFYGHGGDRLLVVQSGIHGVEGPAGAAVQRMVMRKYLARFLERGVDVLFIHALDPYGFKNNRRTDGFNVNLNRNFDADGRLFQTKNSSYEQLRPVLEPDAPVGDALLGSLKGDVGLLSRYVTAGFNKRDILIGLDMGQYSHPAGLNYGGGGPAQQTEFLKSILSPLVASPAYGKVLFLDLHTGLGDAGVLAIIKGKKPAEPLMTTFATLLAGHEKDGIVIHTSDDFPTSGDVIDYVPTLGSDRGNILALTLEYGTLGTGITAQLGSATRMILENQAHFHGCNSQAICTTVTDNFRDLFNPADPGWRGKVLSEADTVFRLLADSF
ncbi:M14 family metallopeptidase [Nitrospirillum sp. BR 11164]|uniref:M14 family metallopeptidase n=1 Tax=Nitrospirillum sp. BR 11164 TaxID=3104324 RepID=UPI002AFF8119|nr:M14 family metallopeptidase [Nitrospirillum sp. BR 11164]MEA1650439.1 M14 family metallopeptidase [Nitrospirillum sp. BR 11164]